MALKTNRRNEASIHIDVTAQTPCYATIAAVRTQAVGQAAATSSGLQNTFAVHAQSRLAPARDQSPVLFPLQYHHQAHYPQHDLLHPRMLAQKNRDVSHKGNEADYAANDVFLAVQEGLALCVEFGVVCEIVVTLCEQTEGCLAVGLLVLTP